MQETKISVIIPVYNQEKYLRECLTSVLEQTLREIEIIVVNDGSTDRSLAIIRELSEGDPRVRILDKENSGYGDSVNRGLDMARGEYVGIVESDDFILPEMYERLYALSRGGTIEIVKGNFYDYYDDGGEIRAFANEERSTVPKLRACDVRSEPQILWGHPSIWSGIYKRSLIEENHIRFLPEKGGGWVDNPFFFETLFLARSYLWTDEPLYYYRKTNENSSSNKITDPVLPIKRMEDNLDVAERCGFTDAETLKYLYARALMYFVGAQKDCDYGRNFRVIDRYAKAMLRRCDGDVFESEFNLADQYLYLTSASPIKTLLQSCPKVLIYNWAPFDNERRAGGGVTVYCRNLIDTILKESPATDLYFLSSGYAYDATRSDTYLRAIPNIYGDRVHQFEIVNSPVPADQWLIYRNPTVALRNEALNRIFADFLEHFGPFHVVHFNNLEGLSLDVLDLKEQHPDTRFLYSIHNYNAICLTGFYYQRHRHRICSPDHTAADCYACSHAHIGEDIAGILYERGVFGAPREKCLPAVVWTEALGFERLDREVSPEEQLRYADTATATINRCCDAVLAVSKRVRDIAIANGLSPEKTHLSYIGTRVAKGQIGHSIAHPREGLRLVFLGSDLRYEEKGYPFLLRALERLDKRYAERIDLVLTTTSDDCAGIGESLSHFRSLTIRKSYTHRELKSILQDADLSVVPVLWEDNLPQIAIESVAYGVPVLASDAGGASELCDDPDFRFRHGDEEDFLRKLIAFVEEPERVKEYWTSHHRLVTLRAHWQELRTRYYRLENAEITLTNEDLSYLLREHAFLAAHFHETDTGVDRIGNRTFGREERLVALQRYVENERLLEIVRELGLTERSLWFPLIRKMNRWFPRGSGRRRFLKKLAKRGK